MSWRPWGVFQTNDGASVCELGVHRFYAQSQQDGSAASAYLNDLAVRIAELETANSALHRDPTPPTPRTPEPPSKRERLFLTIFQSLIELRDGAHAMDEANEALSVVNFVDRAL